MPIRFQLPNGLGVVFQEEHTSRVVAFQLWVRAGSADEGPEEAGLAHFHEHMLFKGTKRRGVGEVAREVEAHGGDINAYTSYDQTVYHVAIASAFARVGLDVLADAIRNSTFEPEEVAKEIEVVCEEIKRSEDAPSRRLWRELATSAYRVHPYRLPILGTESSVRSFTREKVRAFYERHYTPENVTLVAVGDVSEENVRRWAEELLGGDWGRRGAPLRKRPQEPAILERRVALRRDDVKEVHLHLAFPTPPMAAPEIPALDAWAVILGQGQASHLALEVKRKRSLVNEIGASDFNLVDNGLFLVSASLPVATLGPALEEIGRVLGAFARAPLPLDDLLRAQQLIESESVWGREQVQGIARKLGSYELGFGGFEEEERYYAQVAALVPDKMHEVFVRTLDLSKATFAALLPDGTELDATAAFAHLEKGWKSAAPADVRQPATAPAPVASPSPAPHAARPRKAGPGGVVVETLSNGARLLVREERNVPLFAMRGAFLGGGRTETEATAGINALLARVLTRGAAGRSAEDISRRVDAMAGSLGGAVGRNSLSLRGEFLSRHLEEAFGLFADVLLRPTFPDEELARERKLTLQTLQTKEDRPASLVGELLAKALFPGHPYRFPLAGEIETVEAMTPEALRTHHARHLHPSALHLAVVGDVDAGRIVELAEQAFGAAGKGPPAVEPPPQAKPLARPERVERRLAKAQTHVMFGFRAARLTDPWRYALEVLSNVLSGMGGRLFITLRDQQSLAYSVSSFSVEGVDPGYFGVYIGTSPDKQQAAMDGIRAQLDRVRDERITPAELERARQNLIGGHEIGLQRATSRAALLALDDTYGLGMESFLHYAEQVARVRAEDVQEAARRVIDWDRSVVAVVGPGEGG